MPQRTYTATSWTTLAALEQDIVKRLLNMLHERPQLNPMLLQSVAMPDCIVRARDVTECGALSTSIVIGFDGLGVFLRSLATIKQLCYDAQRVPMSKVLSALKANCNGDDALNRLMNMPKPEMEDALLEKFLHNVGELFMAVSERPEISVRPSLLQMPCMGAHLMATPDGRLPAKGWSPTCCRRGLTSWAAAYPASGRPRMRRRHARRWSNSWQAARAC